MARRAKEQADKKLTKLNSNPKVIEKRKALKEIISSTNIDINPEEKWEAMLELSSRKRNESICRQKSRCPQCGRIQSVIRKFGMCRCCVRKYFHLGYLPGLVKSSW